jgi:hypothetical protein
MPACFAARFVEQVFKCAITFSTFKHYCQLPSGPTPTRSPRGSRTHSFGATRLADDLQPPKLNRHLSYAFRIIEVAKISGLTQMRGPHSDSAGGINGSTQHSLNVHVEESTKLNSFKGVDVNGTLPRLGSVCVQPSRSVPQRKYGRINRLDGVASTG